MRIKSLLAALAAACLAAAGAARAADMQDGKTQMTVAMRSGAFVVFTTETVPAGPRDVALNFIESEDKPNLIHRVFVDKEDDLFFGYELLVEPVAAARQFRVSVRPLSPEYQEQLRTRLAFRNRRLHPNYNPSAFPSRVQVVGDGDTFALDVLQNPRTGAKLVDVITVSLDDPRLQSAPASRRPARDFSLEDVQLRVTGYKLRVNGETIHSSTSGCSGALIWFSLPGRGRFIFSLVPRPGYDFRKAGAIEHNKISFTWGGERYEWVSSLPVVGVGGNWNVWVLHDPDYSFDLFNQPAPPAADPTLEQKVREGVRPRSRTEFEPHAGPNKPAPARRARVAIGAAERMEGLLPKGRP